MFVSVKQKIKKIVKQMPGARSILFRLDALKDELQNLSFENQLLANENIDLRLKLKKINGEKVNVVFVCHRPAVWESLHSVYDALVKDDLFKVTIVAIPIKKQLPDKGFNHDVYESEGAEEFWESYGCVNGYNCETHEWLNLQTLEPDYVFFQQPYNVTRCNQYKSWVVSKYAKIIYVPYGIQVVGGYILDEVNPDDFLKNVFVYAATDRFNYRDLNEKISLKKIPTINVVNVGSPRIDWGRTPGLCDSRLWKYHGKERRFRILWTPRWTTNENTCTFFEYKEHILQYAKDNKDVEIMFRPHPQAFQEWDSTGEMTEKQQEDFRAKCHECGVTLDETGDYLESIRTTDCFLTDITSLMAEFYLTKKPIIYCQKRNMFTELGENLAQGYYTTQNWKEVEETLNMLKNHNDPLLQRRLSILEHELCLSDKTVGESIKDILKKDALK